MMKKDFYKKQKFWVIFISVFAFFYIFVMGDNSCSNVGKIDDDIRNKQNQLNSIEEKIKKVEKQIQEKDTPKGLERMAREKHNFKRDNEDIYIIEFDTIN